MSKKWFLCVMTLLGLFVLSSGGIKAAQANSLANTKTLILYDAMSGAIPDTSLMSFADFPFGGIVPTYSEGATIMDTTIAGNEVFAGWISSAATILGFPILDRTEGVQVNLTVQVESESHTRDTRSGLSLIVLDKDKKGIELSFGENEIWAKSDDNTGGLFARGEDVAFATTGMVAYQLTLIGDTYTLTANGQTLLTGPIRDYTSFDGFPDPYETPNFLFLGDNTTSAQARIRLQFVSVVGSEPVAVTSTSDPSPTVVNTPLPEPSPAVPPTPQPTPTQQPMVVLCPSGWIVAGGVAGVWMNRKFGKMIR
jgi:hypothetical protein